MFLLSVLLSAATFMPAMTPHGYATARTGTIFANAISPDKSCKPGDICASKKTTLGKGCFFNNLYKKGSYGGTPLAVNVTETGSSTTYVYWVNNTNTTLGITGNASANYYCP
ncbi:MAG: hypothetical protein WB609_12360 [Candidatus Cybelea sp.]